MTREKRQFIPVTQAPKPKNPWYTRKKYGGYSPCIDGKPQAWEGSTLNNCVGNCWAETAWREDDKECKIGCAKGHDYPSDAYVWIQNSKAQGYEIGTKAELGATAVWVSIKNSKRGHVGGVEMVYPDGSWDSSESGLNTAKTWWSKHYNANSYKAGYKFLGFVLPKYEYVLQPEYKYKVGDLIQIIGKGNSRPDGKGVTSYGIRYKRYILKIHKGQPFPYQVGSKSGITTGYYKEEALKKL